MTEIEKSDSYFQTRNIAEVVEDGLNAKPQRKIGGSFLFEETTTYLFSRNNYGKSLLVFQLAYCAATGTSLDPCQALINECEPMKVLVVDLELEARDLAKRHGNVISRMDPLLVNNLIYLHEKIDKKVVIGFELLDKIEQAAVYHNAKLVIIDNISKLLPDSLKAETVTLVISTLNRIRLKTGAALLVIGHTTKGNHKIAIQPSDYYGSSMVQNFFYHISYLDKTKDGKFFLCNTKIKHEESYEDIVPVFTRGSHPTVGVGFTFEQLLPLSEIQLPASITVAHPPKKRNLGQFKKEIAILDNAGIKRSVIASMLNVDRTSIYRLFEG